MKVCLDRKIAVWHQKHGLWFSTPNLPNKSRAPRYSPKNLKPCAVSVIFHGSPHHGTYELMAAYILAMWAKRSICRVYAFELSAYNLEQTPCL